MAAKWSCIVPNCKSPTVCAVGKKYFSETALFEEWAMSVGITGEELRAFEEEKKVCETHRPDEQSWGFCLVPHHPGVGKGSQPQLMCRLCMEDVEAVDAVDIFDTLQSRSPLANVITLCIQPLKISKQDNLSKVICEKCYETVKKYQSFRSACIRYDKIQRDSAEFNSKRGKRKLETEHSGGGGRTVKKISGDGSVTVSTTRSRSNRSDQVASAELLRVLTDRLPDDMKSADNIIIEVRSDDDEVDAGSLAVDVKNEAVNVFKIGKSEVTLPKGIAVSPSDDPKTHRSRTGVCDALIIKGMCDTSFVMIDGYLFEFGLVKDNVRHLNCAKAGCPTTAHQVLIRPDLFENKATVEFEHNHKRPCSRDLKLQMCLHLIRKRMNNDKTLNLRCVYDRLCEEDPELRETVPIKTVINQMCTAHLSDRSATFKSFQQFYDAIESDRCRKLQFTQSNRQFYQERFTASDGSRAVLFANVATIEQVSTSKIMYVDSSFKIGSKEDFDYHLVTVLVWIDDSFYPILFALVNEKTREIYKTIFSYLRDTLAPDLRPEEIITDYEASLYYALSETYLESRIGGSVFYYTQNLYKKICSLNLSRDLETNSCFRNIYHMILMLPLLPVNTILDGLNNIELQASELGLSESMRPIFDYVKAQWIDRVTPDFFCVHGLENRINENVVAPFKKLRDFLMLSKGKMAKQQINLALVVEKLIELETFLEAIYSAPSKKSFARDLSSTQKRNVIRAWQFIESHPKININNFFSKVLGYIKCMENQLWIWGFYRYAGDAGDELINAENFSIINMKETNEIEVGKEELRQAAASATVPQTHDDVVMDVVIENENQFQEVFLNYVQKD